MHFFNLNTFFQPLEIRQDVPKRAKKVDALGLYVGSGDSSSVSDK